MRGAFKIRPVLPQDAPAWLKLRCALWPDGVEDHEMEIAKFFTGSLIEPQAVFVAVNPDNRILAFAELSVRQDVPTRENIETGFIEGLYVTPEMRFSGVARA